MDFAQFLDLKRDRISEITLKCINFYFPRITQMFAEKSAGKIGLKSYLLDPRINSLRSYSGVTVYYSRLIA
jgi:hypothetical protein